MKLAKIVYDIFSEQGHIIKIDELEKILNVMPETEYNDFAEAVNIGDFNIILRYLGNYSDEILKPLE